MIIVNLIAWITLILSVIACASSTVTMEKESSRLNSFLLLAGYICTIVAFASK